ncbi:MAG: ABC transporter permease [Anaerolineales bacterium]
MSAARRFFSRWQNWLALALTGFFVAAALFAPLISPDDPARPGIFRRVGRSTEPIPQPPAPGLPLGTLPGQIDVFHALIWGARQALTFGLTVTLLTATFGIFWGMSAALRGGWLNDLMMRIADAFLAFPVIAGVAFLNQLLLSALLSSGMNYFSPTQGLAIEASGPPSLLQLILQRVDALTLTLILFSWMPYARLMAAQTQHLKQAEFIQAARSLGAGNWRVLLHHLLPNAVSPAIVLAARDIGAMVILQSTFTFIGFGGGSPWGSILSQGRNWMIGPGGALLTYWWVFIPATLAIVFFGIGWNLLGDGLNDLLDPYALD